MYVGYYLSPIGWLEIKTTETKLVSIEFVNDKRTSNTCDYLKEVIQQLAEYFDGRRQAFDLRLDLSGTEFQIKAWKALLAIPYGNTWSYKQQAEFIKSPKGFRAVGGANGKNRIPIVIPCHRVISSDGNLGGFSSGLDRKLWLLNHEKSVLGNDE